MDTEPTDPEARLTRAAAMMMRRLDTLATCTDGPGLTRLPFTPAHRAAVAMVGDWMRAAGLAVSLDAAGTLIGRREGPPGARTLLIGSHLDTVRDAGRFDGAFGVLAGIAAVEALGDIALPFAIEVLGFADEEGVRYPVTLTGSRAIAGSLDPAILHDARDADGISFAEALTSFGGDPAAIGALARDPAGVMAYLEPHIEQGPVLERAGLRIGVVSAINGATRMRFVVHGRPGHAGTEPMAGRRDALVAAAEMVGAVRTIGLAHASLTATVGQMTVLPGAANVVPGEVRFSLDLRAPDDALRAQALAEIRSALWAIAQTHHVDCVGEIVHEADAARCDADWQARLHQAAAGLGEPTITLPSGAGHDAMVMGALCPVAMLFARCREGLSHHPDEFLAPEDGDATLRILVRTLLAAADQTP